MSSAEPKEEIKSKVEILASKKTVKDIPTPDNAKYVVERFQSS
jgi:hypothetical protein